MSLIVTQTNAVVSYNRLQILLYVVYYICIYVPSEESVRLIKHVNSDLYQFSPLKNNPDNDTIHSQSAAELDVVEQLPFLYRLHSFLSHF